jgi:hypothetical protein
MRKKILHTVLVLLALGTFTGTAWSQSVTHNYVNTTRSSAIAHILVSQSVEGEYGEFEISGAGGTLGLSSSSPKVSKWRGYNLSQTLGVEIMKFIQFNVSHSMMNMRSSASSLERLGGSRFSGGAKLVFTAPLANLEAGGGVIGTRYDYQRYLSTSDFYGSGLYYSLGFNYFMSERVSFFGQAKSIDEHSVRTGGNSEAKSINSRTTNIGTGFTLWL